MTDDTGLYARLALADDLHLTWDRHVVTVASPRWDPSIFVYDVEYLTIDAKPSRAGYQVVIAARGASHPHQVLRFELSREQFTRFDAFIVGVRVYRDRLRAAAP